MVAGGNIYLNLRSVIFRCAPGPAVLVAGKLRLGTETERNRNRNKLNKLIVESVVKPSNRFLLEMCCVWRVFHSGRK